MMEEMLKQILGELKEMRSDIKGLNQGQNAIKSEMSELKVITDTNLKFTNSLINGSTTRIEALFDGCKQNS